MLAQAPAFDLLHNPLAYGGLVLLVAWLVLWRRGHDPLKLRPFPAKAIRPLDAAMVTIGGFGLLFFGSALSHRLGLSVGDAGVAGQLAALAAVGPGYLVLTRSEEESRWPGGRPIILGVLAWLACLPLVMLALILSANLFQAFDIPWKEQAVLSELRKDTGTMWGAVRIVLSAMVLAPILEEIVFRGFLYRVLRRATGVGVALGVSSVAFALIHDRQVMIPIFVVGVALAWVYERTGSLAGPIAFHTAFNGLTVVGVLAG